MSALSTRLALVGDSIAWGQGAARQEDRLGPRIQAALQRHGVAVDLRVFAVPGARSRDLASQVDQAQTWQPDLALVIIGANDLTHREPVADAVQALSRAVRRLRDVGAEVVVAPAPDLGAVPHVPVSLQAVVREASNDLRRRQAAAVRAEGGHVADEDGLTSTAFAADPSMFSADRFHPSSAGYAVIADALLPTVVDAAEKVASRS